jgi:hypothetical protein
VRAIGGAHLVVEEMLTRMRAHVVLRLPYFMVLPMVQPSTDALFTVPSQLAEVLVANGTARSSLVPVEIPRFDISVYWHERFDTDPGMSWMRQLLVDLFSGRESVVAAPGRRAVTRPQRGGN